MGPAPAATRAATSHRPGSAPRRWTAPSRMWSNTSKVLILTKYDHWEPNVAYLKPLPEIGMPIQVGFLDVPDEDVALWQWQPAS
jgi:hypothetical protein